MEQENWQDGAMDKKPQRQRIARSERAYTANGTHGEHGAFRPQGFDRRNNDQQGYQPRQGGRQNNYNQEGGYNREAQRSYGQRPYGQHSNQGYGQQRQGGYNQQNRQGGYGQQQNRQGGYNQNRQGGYGQQQNRQGGYGQQQNRQGGYGPQQRRQGGRPQRPNGTQGFFRQRSADYDPNAKYSMKKQIEYKEYLEDPNAPMRLNKFLANAGVCSRREADQFIQAGLIRVNGEVVSELGSKVYRTDEIHFHSQLVTLEKKVYVVLNKPKDYVTTNDDPQARKTVMDLVKGCCRERIYPVGRLDRNTTGVLLFTNDGALASKLTHPKYLKKKIYQVQLDKNCTAADLRQIADGITLDDGPIRADAISYASDTDKKIVGIEIHSGKNRIVRRIFEHLGYRVLKLDRVMFAGLTKKGLKRGDWRFLTEQEVAMLHMNTQD